MRHKNIVAIPIVLLVILMITSNTHACCGHCSMGPGYHTGMKSNKKHAAVDSVALKKFLDENVELSKKIEEINAKIKKEYSNEPPDFDKIAKLKKQIIDYHTELEKKAANSELAKHHNCWCTMHHCNWW
jgi:hypothetical protein